MRIGNPSSSLTITLAVNTLELHQFSLWVLLQPMCHKWCSDTVNIYNLTKLTYFYLKWQSQGTQTLHSKRYLIIAVPVGHNSSSDELSVFHPHLYIFYRFTCTSVYTRIIICLQCSYLCIPQFKLVLCYPPQAGPGKHTFLWLAPRKGNEHETSEAAVCLLSLQI